MTSITLRINGASACASVTGPLTSGMVGIPVIIEYDESWNGLSKNLVCRCSPEGPDSGESRVILNARNSAVVAHEVMKPDMYLYLGVEGFNENGKLVVPTTWAMCGRIRHGANADGDLSAAPELPVWNQLQVQIEQIKQDAITQEQVDDIQADVQAARSAAEAAAQRAEEAVGNGITPHIGADGNWWIGDTDTGVRAQGPQGPAYELTDDDRNGIAADVLEALPKWTGGAY